MPRINPIPPDHRDPYAADDMELVSAEDIDEFSDPFEIAAAKEEAAGVPLVFLIIDHND